MELLNTMSTGAAGATDTLRLTTFREGMQAEGLRLRCKWPVTVGTAGTPTTSDLVSCLKYFLSALSLKHGPSQEHTAYDSVPGDELRSIYRAVEMDEVPNNFVGVAQTAAAHTWQADLFLPFRHPMMRGRQRRPGWTQCRSMRLDVVEGSSLTAGALNLSRTAGNATVDIIPVYRPGKDTIAPVLSYRRINSPRLDVEGPDGLVLVAWDANAAYASNGLTKYSAQVGGRPLITNLGPDIVNDEWSRLIDAGGSNVTDVVTLVYFADPWSDIDHAPAGRLTLQQADQYLTTLMLRVLYWPDLGESEAAYVQYAARERKEAVVGSKAAPPAGADPGANATAPLELVHAKDPAFFTAPGIGATPDGTTFLSVPQVAIAAGSAAVNGAAAGTGQAVASQVQRAVAQRVPGAIATSGHTRGGTLGRQGIRSTFAPLFRGAK